MAYPWNLRAEVQLRAFSCSSEVAGSEFQPNMQPPSNQSKTVALFGYDGVGALDLFGPNDTFSTVGGGTDQAVSPYRTIIVGLDERPFKTETGVQILPEQPVDWCHDIDTLVLPGGAGLRDERINASIVSWIQDNHQRIRRIASVCTGIYGLAPTGLLDGRIVTTHWRFANDLARRFPKLTVDAKQLFIRDGKFLTSAGITAGVDLTLAMIEDDFGPSAALATARELIVYLKRQGGQHQFSAPLQFQIDSRNKFADLLAWISDNLQDDLSVEHLADRACLSPRQFARRFTEETGSTPGAYVEGLRLSSAAERLTTTRMSVGAIGHSVGFRSTDAFTRAFARHFGLRPSAYRDRFTSSVSELME